MSEDEWDFYPCRVDDEPASILVNLRFAREQPSAENDHLHLAYFEMQSPGEHGVGTGEEAQRLGPLEDALFERANAAGAVPVGRLRGQGLWQLCVYGPAELPWDAWVSELGGADVEVRAEHDPDFSYLNDFLLPDSERLQWMMDRRVCEQLREHGDDLVLERPVDHHLDCQGAASPALMQAVAALGFEVRPTETGLECTKVHGVELETVHEIVMQLTAVAEQHGVEYDGWGCPVERPDPTTSN
jgi:regulator of RNase E activity RraB